MDEVEGSLEKKVQKEEEMVASIHDRGWSRLSRGYRLTILQNYEKMVSMSDSVGS